MKKLLLTFSLILLVFCSVFAQKQYTYLKGQESPFNGEFNEPRYIGVDSISYESYIKDSEQTYSLYSEDIQELTLYKKGYTLIKSSSDGLVDTLRSFIKTLKNDSKREYEHIKQYSDDEKLIYFSSKNYIPYSIIDMLRPGFLYYMEEKKYIYDTEGRIFERISIKNHDGAATLMTYDTIKYDYEFKSYLNSVTLKCNTIQSRGDIMYVFYFDENKSIETIEQPESVNGRVDTQYLFDNQGRLMKTTKSFPEPVPTISSESIPEDDPMFWETITIEYKYTNSGYEQYENGVKAFEYKFQDDGYCTEIIQYSDMFIEINPPVQVIKSIEKFSYFKDGKIIVDNIFVEKVAPKVYGIQGGVSINTEKSLPVSIFTFSGGFVKQTIVSAGTNTIPMTKGLYIVLIGNMSYKILVK
jgi:hypothetical protein